MNPPGVYIQYIFKERLEDLIAPYHGKKSNDLVSMEIK